MNIQHAFLLSWLTLTLTSAPAVALQQVAKISRIEDVIQRWTPEQHLYVKGDLGVGDAQYAGLEQWLDENGPHWTIVLLQTAEGEQYRAPDGRVYVGMDAVEYALGYGLANRTGFGQLENPQTGETDGAVFVLFLAERKFSYYGSEAQDRRGLGESRWVGDLDQPAFRAMRSGGRILDAVKDTVTTIDARLRRAIQAEAESEARAARERVRALSEFRVDLQHAREAVVAVTQTAQQLHASAPAAQGPLTQPPVEDWNRRLGALGEEVNEQNVRTSAQQLSELMAEIDRHLNWYAQYESFAARQADLAQLAQPMQTQFDGVAAASANTATEQLAAAAAAHANGDPAFVDQLRAAEQAIHAGQQSIEAEQARRARVAARRRLIWYTALITLALALLGLMAFLWWLNRRRAPARQKAMQEMAAREKSVRAEMDRVLQLFERSREILGTKEKIAARGYVGQTKQLSDDAFQKVDDLLIMSNEVDRVMDEAEELIRPGGVVGKIQNQFSATRYERGINRMSGEPLTFHEDQGIPAILRTDAKDGRGGAADKVSLTFEQVFSAFRKRAQQVTETLDVVETSLLQVNDQLGQLEQQIEQATELDKQLAAAEETDGFFRVPKLFEVLIPSAEADHDQADEIAGTDPVKAVREDIPRGQRKITEALQIAGSIQRARESVFPQFDQHAPRLKQLSYDTDWIQSSVRQLGARADELFGWATERSVAAEAQTFDADITALGERVVQCAELAESLQANAVPAIDQLESDIHAARERISQQLGLPFEQCLQEDQANPDLRSKAARQQLAAARAALQHGGIDAAQSAARALQSEVETGTQIVTHSLETLDRFERDWQDVRNQHGQVQASVPELTAAVGRTQEEFAESALRLQASDPAYPDPKATLASRMGDVAAELHEAWELLEQAQHDFRSGKMLEADGRVQVGRSSIDHAQELLSDVRGHIDRLAAKTRENAATVAELTQRIRELERPVRDPRTMRPTLAEYEHLLQSARQAEHDVIEARIVRDPFGNAERLHDLAEQITKVEGLIAADRQAHAEAARAVAGAYKQLETAQRYVQQAQRDGIPDSALTVRCVREIQQLEGAVHEAKEGLNAEHGDWQNVDEQAARLNAELGTQAARLKGELERAQKSVDALQRASRDVFDATRWTGRYGIRVTGAPGAQDLERARQALNMGDYEMMIQLSRAAAMAAQFAIQQAEREILRRQREEARRAEAARRAEMARRRSSSPSISFGSRGGGSSISFGGGGGSRGSSGSGFSRSGW